jgi:acyl-CoA dehydrogenase
MFVMGGDPAQESSRRASATSSRRCTSPGHAQALRGHGRPAADAPMHWAIWDAMFKMQNAFEGVISNYPNASSPPCCTGTLFPLGRPYEVPSDHLGHEVAQTLIEPSATRDRLTAGMYVPWDRKPMPSGVIELALEATRRRRADRGRASAKR